MRLEYTRQDLVVDIDHRIRWYWTPASSVTVSIWETDCIIEFQACQMEWSKIWVWVNVWIYSTCDLFLFPSRWSSRFVWSQSMAFAQQSMHADICSNVREILRNDHRLIRHSQTSRTCLSKRKRFLVFFLLREQTNDQIGS